MLRNYLQSAIGSVSVSTFSVGRFSIPIVPTVAIVLAGLLLAIFRPRIARRHLIAAAVAIGMIALAQQITDYYFGHRFFELQMNWHYFAYGIFALLMYRDLKPRGLPFARIMLVTFGLALLYSTFDEGFQLMITSRIFDTSDIGKDGWGALTGITVLLIAKEQDVLARGKWKTIRRPTLKAYLDHASSVWVLLVSFTLMLLSYSSLLADARYAGTVLMLTLGTFAVFLMILHLSRIRPAGRALLGLAVIGALALAVQMVRHRNDQIVERRYAWTVYKGFPIPFFDVMIFRNGGFRLVDKKHLFNARDRKFLNGQGADIIIIGAGYRGEGGKGFPHQSGTRFIYNPVIERASQVIILPTPAACDRFNLLKGQGKNVLFVIHATC